MDHLFLFCDNSDDMKPEPGLKRLADFTGFECKGLFFKRKFIEGTAGNKTDVAVVLRGRVLGKLAGKVAEFFSVIKTTFYLGYSGICGLTDGVRRRHVDGQF